MLKKSTNNITKKVYKSAIVADIIWFVCFIVTWGSLIILWNTWWVIILVPIFTIFLAGMAEVIHQAAHNSLFGRSLMLNKLVGSFASAMMFGIDLQAYRRFHFKHHQTVNTLDDPERILYASPAYIELVKIWDKLSFIKKIFLFPSVIAMMGKELATELSSKSPLVHIFRWGIPLAILFIGFLEGYRYLLIPMVFIVWYLPFGLFLIFDIFLTQGEHYGTPNVQGHVVKASDQYKISWNLELPIIIKLMIMGRNLHAEHHENPGIHWSISYDRKIGRTLPFKDYLQSWWAKGPRVST